MHVEISTTLDLSNLNDQRELLRRMESKGHQKAEVIVTPDQDPAVVLMGLQFFTAEGTTENVVAKMPATFGPELAANITNLGKLAENFNSRYGPGSRRGRPAQ